MVFHYVLVLLLQIIFLYHRQITNSKNKIFSIIMNINYEINNLLVNTNIQYNKKNIYAHTEINDQLYIFELELINTNNFSHFIRKIIKNYNGNILIDNVDYNNIIKYSLLIIDVNNIDNIIIIKGEFNNTKIKNNNITINFIKSFDNSIICNYIL